MPDDLYALLAAIVADPADDTARLVYADCLQEYGNNPRANFIRLQVETERLHPDSNARARLEERAEALFAEHWIDWWREVCTSVGFSIPAARPGGAIGRLARRVGITNLPGHPYDATRQYSVRPRVAKSFQGWNQTTFRRGFPDRVRVSYLEMNPDRHFLQRWLAAAPLDGLLVTAPYTEHWIDGAHLVGLRNLFLDDYDPVALIGVLNSPHLTRLESLWLQVPPHGDLALTFGDEFARAVESPRMRQLKRLSIPVWSDRAAEVVAGAENLSGLESLEVSLQPAAVDDDMEYGSADLAVASERVAVLARSPYLKGLRELKIVGEIDAAGIEAVIQNPTWTGLRKLDLHSQFQPIPHYLLEEPDDLSELEELRLSGVSYSVNQVSAFARSPLLKRLRHFAVQGGPYRSVDFDIAHAVDPDRIETFAIGKEELQTGVAAKLQYLFGDRFRVLP